VLGTAVLLSFAPWFSASAVGPLLAAEWHTSGLDLPLLTVAVQLGFAIAAILLALSGAADAVPGTWLIAAGAVVAALGNLGFAAFATGPASAIPWRLLTGAGLAAVYPVALKMLAGWVRPAARSRHRRADRRVDGRVGAAAPDPGARRDERSRLAADRRRGERRRRGGGRPRPRRGPPRAVRGAVVTIQPGGGDPRVPRAVGAPRERRLPRPHVGALRDVDVGARVPGSVLRRGRGRRSRDVRGRGVRRRRERRHRLRRGRRPRRHARPDDAHHRRDGRSGGTALVIGFLFGAAPRVVTAVAVVWGVTVVADSAQFSTAVSELSPPGTAGSALSLQLATGFILTGVTILGVGLLAPADGSGWRVAWVLLALGPAAGIAAMWRLRGRPDATKMANGHR
jgi:hypothetical protein